ncbi:MAG: phosphate/phosphite/phosphonate ABC transporter substrate-binding protein [Sulfuricellaceae bacterium]|nr:phosphate/phosphite/phosphonate ABC transporter substrate-binding protein [Sulfuricellaceae bacterium]
MHPTQRIRSVLMPLLGLLLGACERAPAPSGPEYGAAPQTSAVPLYRLAIHPLHNPQKLSQAYQPLIDHLNRNLPEARFELEASRDYAAYEVKFRACEPHFLLPNPWQSLQAMKVGYQIIAMAGNAEDFKGIFIVRKDSPIKTPADLKGKAVSYPAPTALAAAIMPQWFLHQQGIDVNRDIENRYVGSQESSILNVFSKDVAVAATWPPPWRAFQKDHPAEAAELKVIWETPHLLNNSVMARDDVPAAIRERVQSLLAGLQETEEGRAILAGMETARFHPADDASYAPVREFIERFEKEVRPVETNWHGEASPKIMKHRLAMPVSLSPNSLPGGERDVGSLREFHAKPAETKPVEQK